MSLSESHSVFLKTYCLEARERLLVWFVAHAREMPWREARTPYGVWVSEVMLQQTQVETVRDYYLRFMKRFPTIAALAAASLEDVLKVWEGLGYYSRARSLHRAAQVVVTQYGGDLPADVDVLRGLPGIGPYTAGAIASIAFGIPTPAVDGNVRRVMARVLATATPSFPELEAAVRAWLPDDAPGPFTEALMELGATLCRPRSPKCLFCPWRDLCQARALGQQQDFPAPKPRKAIPHYDVAAAVILRENSTVLVAQRCHEDMLGGLWEFPGGKCEAGETLPDALHRELQEEMGIDIAVGEPLITLKHAYTHFRITLHAFVCQWMAGTLRCIDCEDFLWATIEDLRALPMAVTDRKIAEVVEALLLKT